MDHIAVRSMREQTIYMVRSNMMRDDACRMIVPSDLRLLIGALDERDKRIAELESAALAAKLLLEPTSDDSGTEQAWQILDDVYHQRNQNR
ncbi:MAG: hypothetical protein EBS91_11815 [Betaproteobacteria bacterium]|nr:hypothetical protein [Betaproteobacteria bacterium]NCA25251.1 hypothetical protein [Betaproteobacteria bacterium]